MIRVEFITSFWRKFVAGKNGLGGWVGFIVIIVGVNLLSYLFGWGFTLW